MPTDWKRRKHARCPFEIRIDNREQLPWEFKGIKVDRADDYELQIPYRFGTLDSGDYSIVGFENQIAIERKSAADLFGTLGSGRARFQRELDRMASLEVAAVVVEADWLEIMANPPRHSKLNPHSVRGTIIAWAERIPRIHWWLLPGRIAAERHAFYLLDRFWRDWAEANELDVQPNETTPNGLARSREQDSQSPGLARRS